MKKAWTPDNCPLQVGSVVHDPKMNADRMITRRFFSHEDDNTDEDRNLITLDTGVTYTGKGLMDYGFTYYPEWPCTLDKQSCCDEVKDEPDIGKLAQCVFDGLRSANIAKEDVHYSKEDGIYVWEDDLAKIFKEYKHDE